MQSKYIYAGTYSSLLINRLLPANQRELLLATTSLDEVRKVLQDTCFSPYLDINQTLSDNWDKFVTDQKEKIVKIAPEPEALDMLFLRYDYANLKLIHRALNAKESEGAILGGCSNLSTIKPLRLYQAIAAGNLQMLSEEFADALKTAAGSISRSLSDVLDQAYFNHVKTIDNAAQDKFVSKYVSTIIDLHNLKMRLRSFVHTESEAIIVKGEMVDGGTLSPNDLESLETILNRVHHFGGKKIWSEAVTKFTENHDFTAIDRAADNYLAQFLKTATIDIHSPAPLFAYFLSVLDHTQFVRAVIAARNVGLSEIELRALVRNSIHDYAY